MLELKGLSRHFGGVRAVDGLDLTVRKGEIVGLIGPNGSGKSTTVNVVAGLFPATSGEIVFQGEELRGLPTHKRLQLGIARTFQNIRLFGQLSVWQNLWVAQNAPEDRARRGFFARWLGGQSGVRAEIAQLLEFSGLAHKQNELAANLAFGEQRRLELARALAAKPKLLLLDEPAAGMNSEEIGQLRDRILKLRAQGITIVLIEHVMELVMGVTDRIAVLNFGQKIAEGSPAEIQANPLVRKAYLGGA
ncbi:MAG TPA: ABC transporter ATP-binding protein [Burkholderiales bacterium]|nr:ABC transporter ATP-binding protein [Burkholderiales bacterium]